MSRHRLEPPPRVRPRVGRLVAAAAALAVTGVALLSGIGVINLDASPARASTQSTSSASGSGAGVARDQVTPRGAAPSPTSTPDTSGTSGTSPSPSAGPTSSLRTTGDALPAGSGNGRRIVFSISDQRVWLVDAKGAPVSTYLVSGSVTHNLKPGRYDVYSRSRWAVGVDDSGVMQYFVRFTRGNNAAIGFHSIPTKQGKPLQTFAQLGTPQSHGCIRQKLSDAVRLWNFAPIGTDVVVVA